jgi:hypothetical protein
MRLNSFVALSALCYVVVTAPWLKGCKDRGFNQQREADASSFVSRKKDGFAFLLTTSPLIKKSALRSAKTEEDYKSLQKGVADHVCFYQAEVPYDHPSLGGRGSLTPPQEALKAVFAPVRFPPARSQPYAVSDVLQNLRSRSTVSNERAQATRAELDLVIASIEATETRIKERLEAAQALEGLPNAMSFEDLLEKVNAQKEEVEVHIVHANAEVASLASDKDRRDRKLDPLYKLHLSSVKQYQNLIIGMSREMEGLAEERAQNTRGPLTENDPGEFHMLQGVLGELEGRPVNKTFFCPTFQEVLEVEKSRPGDPGHEGAGANIR